MEPEAKNILILLGSPRPKGNSAALAGRIAKGAAEAGAIVETVPLNKLDIRPCQACDACRKPGNPGCVQKDDMQDLYPKVEAADALVLATPVYWFTMSAQLKLFLDRCYMFGATDYSALKGKRLAAAVSYGDEDPFASGGVNALRSFQDMAGYVGMAPPEFVYGSADEAGEIEGQEALMKKAEELGRKLAAG